MAATWEKGVGEGVRGEGITKYTEGPGWCGSVDGAPACNPKGHWFDCQSGHTPGLPVRSPVGGV